MALVQVVTYEGGPDVFAWKFPNNELGTLTQLVVSESQEAVLLKDGQICDIFTAGRHTLSTNNIPILNKLINLPFGGNSPFRAQVWFINKQHSLNIKWGTGVPIQLQDPKYQIMLPVRAFGQFGIKITDSVKFLTKLVGTLPSFNSNDITEFFRGLYLTKAKVLISKYLSEKGVSILEINAHLLEISEEIKTYLTNILSEEYGISLINFFVKSINTSEDDPSVIQLKEALAKRATMNIKGFDYNTMRSFDVLEEAAGNQSQNPMMSAGMGFGMGGALGGMMGDISNVMNTNNNNNNHNNNSNNSNNSNKQTSCTSCNALMGEDARFCPKCGTPNASLNLCISCSTELSKDAAFCHKCGTPQQKNCTNCGENMTPDARFCSKCGTPH